METTVVGAFLDTHAAVFLWEGRTDVWTTKGRTILESAQLWVSPVVRLELTFLHEVGRIRVEADEILGALMAECGVAQSPDRIADVVAKAKPLMWTRDPFDRLIVATASLHDALLLTRDRKIREHATFAVW